MKKLLIAVLTVLTALSCGALFVACEDVVHTHEYSAEWSSNAEYHWHNCEGNGCLEVSDKAAHSWSEGEDPVCTVCGKAKPADTDVDEPTEPTEPNNPIDPTEPTEPEIGEVTSDEWTAAVALSKFGNVTIEYVLHAEEATQKSSVLITSDGVFRDTTFIGADEEDDYYHYAYFYGDDAAEQANLFFSCFIAVLQNKENFTYDETDKTYKATTTISTEITMGNSTGTEEFENAKVRFNTDGTLNSFTAILTETVNGHSAQYTMELTCKDYGTTVLPENSEEPEEPVSPEEPTDPVEPTDVVGEYKLSTVVIEGISVDAETAGISMSLTIKADGTFILDNGSEEPYSGDYAVSGSMINLTIDGEPETGIVKGDTITLSHVFEEGSEITLTLVFKKQ